MRKEAETIKMQTEKTDKVQCKKYVKYGLTGILGLALPVLFFYLLEFYTHNPFEEVRPWAQFFNIILFELIAGLLFSLTGRMRTALRIEAAVTMIYGLANAYIVRFRTNPIVPWDIFSLKTGVSVASNYDFTPDKRMVIVTLIFLAVIVAVQPIKIKIPLNFWKRLVPTAAFVLVFGVFGHMLQQEDFQNEYRLYNKLFTPVYMTDVDGIAVTFVMNMAYMSIDKPEGYSTEEAGEILKSYENAETSGNNGAAQTLGDGVEAGETAEEQELPNIIVVMNESFSDLAVLGDFETNRDYMPYLHGLQEGAENTVTGMLNVSVCGGNTANTEFEFLTGNTMAFLPQGSIPYQQYITGEIPSLVNYLRDIGYQTVATHPYYASGWERNTVYPWLGFSESVFLEGYRHAEYVRKYVSDKSCVEKIIDFYENKEEGKPLFVFNVTMQNHGGYQEAFDNFTPEVVASGIDNFALNQYLSLVELSDQELEHLISYFAGVDEKTVVVFFGDHQPSDAVTYSILAKNGMQWNNLNEEELKLRYQVPYVIWANYDIEEAQNADTSVNYLAAEMLRRAGVPTNAYQNFLLELKETYPIITPIRTVKAESGGTEAVSQQAERETEEESGETVSGSFAETYASDEEGQMEVYRKLQYYQLFDGEDRED